MRRKPFHLLLSIMLFLSISSVVSAQDAGQGFGGSSRPAPSGSGGSIGGPGMSGAAVNTGGGGANRGGSFSRGSGGATGTPPDFSGAQAQGTPAFGGQRGEREGRGESGEREFEFGGGFAPFSGEGEGLQGRFGSRGGGSLDLESFLTERGFTGFEGISRDSFAAALQTRMDGAQQATDDAIHQAQAAYDQAWEDYYAAVDYTAQTYYDTVTASADYLQQTYIEAVNYTTQVVNSYIDYYADYMTYCAQYPWDCYAYTYDAATGSYVYTGETSNTVTTTINIGDVTVEGAYPAAGVPTPSVEAYQSLVVFASDQLGAVIDPLYAGSFTGDLQMILAYLPPEMQALAQNAVSASSAAYWGLWQGGGGAVMVGNCDANPTACTVSSDNLAIQLSGASAGVYSLLTGEAAPGTPDAALQLITRVYPKLTGLSFAQVTDIDTGYAFTATTASIGFDPVTQQPASIAKVIYAGVVNVNGQAFVYALVGVGEGFAEVLS